MAASMAGGMAMKFELRVVKITKTTEVMEEAVTCVLKK